MGCDVDAGVTKRTTLLVAARRIRERRRFWSSPNAVSLSASKERVHRRPSVRDVAHADRIAR
jgi:hypothetical protein